MSEQTCAAKVIDVDALLEELRALPPPTESLECFTTFEPGLTLLSDALWEIYRDLHAQLDEPDITTYLAVCNRLLPVLGPVLLTAENRKKLLEILELANLISENFLSVSLMFEHLSNPLSVIPAHSFVRTCLLDFIDQSLASPQCVDDIGPGLQTLRAQIQECEDQGRARLFASDTQWIHDLWESCPEFKALEPWLTEGIPSTTLAIVAQRSMSTGPTSTTAKLTRNSSMVMENLRASMSASSRPMKDLPQRGALLPPQAQVVTALGTVIEVEE